MYDKLSLWHVFKLCLKKILITYRALIWFSKVYRFFSFPIFCCSANFRALCLKRVFVKIGPLPQIITLEVQYDKLWLKCHQTSISQQANCEPMVVSCRQAWQLVVSVVIRRVKSLLDSSSGTVVVGGKTDEDTNYISPTLVVDVPLTDSLMKDEVCVYVILFIMN